MSKIDLASREWCDLVFEGRNREYGAYRARANKGKFQLRALIFVLILIAAIIAFLIAKNAVEAAIEKNRALEGDMVTELSQLKKEEPKKEEKKKEPELKYEEPKEKVKVKASIEFTVPKIVDDDKIDHSKELKTQDEVTKSSFAIASQDYAGDGDGGINIDDLKDNQSAGGTSVPKEEEVVDNALVEVQATYPGGEAALRISKFPLCCSIFVPKINTGEHQLPQHKSGYLHRIKRKLRAVSPYGLFFVRFRQSRN